MRILVLAAHPDDEVLGCGGTIARRVREGHDVRIVILGEGITSRFDRREEAATNDLDRLHLASRRAAELLGAPSPRLYKLPDNRFDTIPLLDVVKVIEREVRDFTPEIVYSQHGGDLNIDHVVTFRATLIATRPLAGCPVRQVYAYEVASSTDWSFGQFAPEFRPQVFVNISDTLDRKLAAMSAYESESRTFPHPRSPEALRAAAARCGSHVGLAAAEAFALVREVN
jgi:LmbE family N-acetylglucosaminyl deacetylase